MPCIACASDAATVQIQSAAASAILNTKSKDYRFWKIVSEAVAVEVVTIEVRLCPGGGVFGVGIGIADVGVCTTGVVVVGVGAILILGIYRLRGG